MGYFLSRNSARSSWDKGWKWKCVNIETDPLRRTSFLFAQSAVKASRSKHSSRFLHTSARHRESATDGTIAITLQQSRATPAIEITGVLLPALFILSHLLTIFFYQKFKMQILWGQVGLLQLISLKNFIVFLIVASVDSKNKCFLYKTKLF